MTTKVLEGSPLLPFLSSSPPLPPPFTMFSINGLYSLCLATLYPRGVAVHILAPRAFVAPRVWVKKRFVVVVVVVLFLFFCLL